MISENPKKSHRYPDDDFTRDSDDPYIDIDDPYQELLYSSFENSQLEVSLNDVFHVRASYSPLLIAEISPDIQHSDASPNLPPPILNILRILPPLSTVPIERSMSLPDMSTESEERESLLIKSIMKRVQTHTDLTCEGCFGAGTKSKMIL
jgi:hypothetical protein